MFWYSIRCSRLLLAVWFGFFLFRCCCYCVAEPLGCLDIHIDTHSRCFAAKTHSANELTALCVCVSLLLPPILNAIPFIHIVDGANLYLVKMPTRYIPVTLSMELLIFG